MATTFTPKLIGSLNLPSTGSSVSISNNTACVSYGYNGTSVLQIIDITNPNFPQPLGSYSTVEHVWDMTMANNLVYTAQGFSGLQIIDVSNSKQPVFKGSYDTSDKVNGIAVINNIAYLADGNNGLRIVDVTNPANPSPRGVIDTAGYAKDVVITAINNSYIAYIADDVNGLRIFDVNDPYNPKPLGSYDTSGFAESVTVVNNKAYIADGDSGLQILDVSNISNPSFLGSFDTAGYAYRVVVVGDTAYVADQSGGLELINVSDPIHPQLISNTFGVKDAFDVTTSGNNVYVADYVGLQVVQASDTSNNSSQALTSQQTALLSTLKSSFNPAISHIAYNADVNDANLYAAGSGNSYLNGECVSYVKLARSDLNFSWGGGATLGSQAATSKGFHVDTAIPMIGSAFVITAGYTGADATYGHTGIVRDVTVQRVFTRGVLQYEYKLELRDSNGAGGYHQIATYSKNLDNFPNHGQGWQFIWGTNTEYDQDKAAIQNIIGQLYDNQLLDSSLTKQVYLDDAKLINRFFLLNTPEKFANFLNLIELYKAELGTAISLADLSGSNLTNDVLVGVKIGTSADETLTGDSGNNVLIGGAGNDTLTGGLANGTEADTFKFVTMHGGTDSITDFVSGTDKIEVIAENFGLKADTAVTLRSGTSLPAFSGTTAQFAYNTSNGELWFDRDGTGTSYEAFHIATLTGSKTLTANDIRAVLGKVSTGDMGGGNPLNILLDTTGLNQLTGSEQNDALSGLDGNDVLNGLGGNDILDGGAGVDTLNGGDGDDLYIVDNSSDVIIEEFGDTLAGIDTVQASKNYTLSANVENLTLTGADIINGTGNQLDNVLKGNDAANILDGGLGVDTMDGGDGNDTYIVDNVSDVVAELYGDAIAGIDTVKASVNYALSSNIENLTLTGTDVINGTGNVLKNILTGNTAANILNGDKGADKLIGGTGNDTLIGGAGKDTLTGGTGADKFKFAAVTDSGITAATRDTITDFKTSQADKIDLSAINANTTVATNNAFTTLNQGTAFSGTFANRAALFFDQTTHVLWGNNDADATADFSILLTGVTTLNTSDFIL